MRWLIKLTIKLTMLGIMLVLIGGGLMFGYRYYMKSTGVPDMPGIGDVQFSSGESDLMTTVLRSALELFSGTRSRNELANDLSDKLYDGRMDAPEMKELGIELDKKPVPDSSAARSGAGAPNSQTAGSSSGKQSSAGANRTASPGGKRAEPISKNSRVALDQLWQKAKVNVFIFAGVVFALLVAFIVIRRRRRRAELESFIPATAAIQDPLDSDLVEMTHAVHTLKTEEFELLVALIYQRQGYRVSLPAALGGERGINFTLLRKAERVLVQCRRLSIEHKVPVERVRELHEAVATAGATRGLLVASCGFTWDARHFAKAKGITLINARMLDALIAAVRQSQDEDVLKVSDWAQKLLSKAELTTPSCPSCEATMDELSTSGSSVWVCSQRPDCRGRRSTRKQRKQAPAKSAAAPARQAEQQPAEINA